MGFLGGKTPSYLLTVGFCLFVCLFVCVCVCVGGGYVVFSYTYFVSVCGQTNVIQRYTAVNHLQKILIMPVDSVFRLNRS